MGNSFIKSRLSSYWIRSAFFMFLQRFSITLFGLLTFMILARTLSKGQLGTYALFLITITTFELSKSALIKGAHIRFVSGSENRQNKIEIASSALLINLFFNVVFILLIFFFAEKLSQWLNAGTELSSMLLYFTPGLIGMVFFSHFEAVQQSHFDFKGVFTGYFIRQGGFFLIIALFVFLKIPITLNDLAIYQSVSIIAGAIVLYISTKKYLFHKFIPSKRTLLKICGYGSYIFGSGIISGVFSNLDQLLTSKFLSPLFVSYYNTASRISGFADIPSYAATEILFPKLSSASSMEGTSKVKYLYEKMSAMLFCFIIPVAIFVIIFPKLVILIIAGAQYYAAAPILQLYMLICLIGTVQNQSANTLNSIGKPGLCLWLNILSFLIKLCITYFGLKYWGFYGAAVSAVISSLLSSVIWYTTMRSQIGVSFRNILYYMRDVPKNILNLLAKKD